MMREAALEVSGLSVSVGTEAGAGILIDDVSIAIAPGEILGLVGESGCGKSTLAKAILGVLPENASVLSGEIYLKGESLLTLGERTLARRIRGQRIGFVPQDPYLSLNPLFTVGAQLLEIMRWHAPKVDAEGGGSHRDRLVRLLGSLQISDPEAALHRFPHEFSGGQLQRMTIAGSLACHPDVIVADEPTSALDVTTQRQILNLLKRRACDYGASVLLVTHDFGIVAEFCDSVAVMYAGQLVEDGPTPEVLSKPMHPYTEGLIACHPDRGGALTGIPGLVPKISEMPRGCRFFSRCEHHRPICSERPQKVVTGVNNDHEVYCFLYSNTTKV